MVTEPAERTTQKKARVPPTSVNVAVVDDDPSVRRGMERLLRSAGFSAITFESAEQFLAICRPEELSCLILDVHLGGMSGLELQATLRKAGWTTPVILITGHDDAWTSNAVRMSGTLYLRKPFDDQVLLAVITRAMGSEA